ncbi:MAG: NADH-quinone oxidoreductase subunit NuoB [Deltaproteobacteria bacterium]|uniref:NADH-quinone oxidoreductase subunit B n=1 Tax=Candidatus Zymogenus saltonus TaxID=2844893 RepID=A0A9D8KCU8_9DELT|nr:NADH-quinone oxidoreductase subunit NuoB [Candidatus Zymogenus saltonus]
MKSAKKKPPEMQVYLGPVDKVMRWAQKSALWPLPFGTACCAVEFMASVASHFDMSRFGAELVRFSPRQADMMIVAGTITNKQAAILRRIYEQMAKPNWVIAMGACTVSGGLFKSYSVLQGIDKIIPVDVYIPGCPPRPEALLYGFMKLQEKIEKGL